ncbi:Peptidoglycan/LPS O-acetylase OafA/YrhL, contains acyltransferase and SGNH-hydrolase domains [Curtobacterium sp. 314Chir4.1]|uniref:acyltransferase family protein n=1 Tax=Curtobacterium sp. 314Chir4.1 TaxID=1279028 RepID=UPI000BDD7308|nr:acyltransferase family protein [Curtobacterium sp. 314Chir4.1]SOC89524.1 Peptidoglycan/LPS O-acetylase OafA/YrhL, contains acyltransferase and SGNH-hydrolase domains [Curtobacterium sp. 314Chir4.1]
METVPIAHRRAAEQDGTRWDIQGLRAFAVLAVVLYHLWPARLPGGFVGVDVFFVISGYLITGHLLREQLADGRIALGRFWARRAKRLLPGAFVTILATGAAVLAVVPSALWGQYGRELIASTVYVQNWQLASDAVDYLASDADPSPFQHFWSLSVEEQFYIALPLLLVLCAAVFRRRGRSPVVTARWLLGAVFVLSLAWCVVQTRTVPGVAYFSTGTRAWEFALGGLAATVPAALFTGRRALRTTGALLGAVALLVALVVITPTTPFPGTAALLPVGGATLVVLLGGGTVLETVGRIPPVAFTGRISYAVYLWHWPAIVLLPIALGHPLGTGWKLLVLGGSIGVAAASTVLLEEPLRFSARVRAMRPRWTALYGALSTVVVVALGASTLVALEVQQRQATEFAQALQRGDAPCFGAAARIGFDDPCTNPRLDDVRVPAASIAAKDDHNSAECWSGFEATLQTCTVGATTGATKHLFAVGDSHSNAWLAVYDEIGKRNGWRIEVAGHGGCYLTTARQDAPQQFQVDNCETWKRAVEQKIATEDLDGVIVTHAATVYPVVAQDGRSAAEATIAGQVEAWRTATDRGIPVVAIRDNPRPRQDVVACVGAMPAGPTTSACDTPRSAAFPTSDGQREAAARVGPLAHVVDLTRYYCDTTTCPAVIGGVLVYRDGSHQTLTFAKTLRPYLEQGLLAALGGA